MALMSGKVYSNTGAPNNADGVNGDIYMQLDGFKTTYRKEGGSWVAVGSTLGAIPEFISGVGVPSNVLGADGQYYRNSTNQDIYYKQGGAWALVGNLLGASFGPVLEQTGIGKYLGTAPNLVTTGSMNDLVIAGEYYVTDSVTNMPPNVGAGYVKVWGFNSGNVGQLVQRTIGASNSPWHIRLSSGGSWGQWVGCATQDGDSTRKFKALAGTALDDVVTVGQLNTEVSGAIAPKALALFIVSAGGVVTIDRSVNVSSITKIAVGKYQVNFIDDLTLPPIIEVIAIDKTTQGGFGAGGITRKQATPYAGTLSSVSIHLRGETTDNNGAGVVLYTDDAYIHLVVY